MVKGRNHRESDRSSCGLEPSPEPTFVSPESSSEGLDRLLVLCQRIVRLSHVLWEKRNEVKEYGVRGRRVTVEWRTIDLSTRFVHPREVTKKWERQENNELRPTPVPVLFVPRLTSFIMGTSRPRDFSSRGSSTFHGPFSIVHSSSPVTEVFPQILEDRVETLSIKKGKSKSTVHY